jgi:hypothetical protein
LEGKTKDVCFYFNCKKLTTLEYCNRTSQRGIKKERRKVLSSSSVHNNSNVIKEHYNNTIKWRVHRALS